MTRYILQVALLGALACSRSNDQPPVQTDGPPPPAALVVTEKGIGPVEVGMTVPHAEAMLRTSLAPPAGTDSAACRVVHWDGAPPGVSLMFEGGKVVRVDVDSSSVPTAAGLKVGDPESRVAELYKGVQMMPHKYVTGGHYLTVVPADSTLRIIFETDGKQVTRYRAGQRPQVEYVERCG